MAVSKRSSGAQQNSDLKQRVISALNKLSDRDTHAMACSELDSIAESLTPDSLATFLSCIYATDSSHKSPVRRHCLRLLSTLASAHADALSPFLPRIFSSALLRRLRDPDSAVRASCVDAVSSLASRLTRPPFSSFFRPLSYALLTEQDPNAQIAAALCLAAAVDSSPSPDPALLHRLLPRLLKLLRSPAFKAKPALLSLIGSVVAARAASSALPLLIPSLLDFLASENWAARKAAAEALTRLASTERHLLTGFKASCLASFDSCRFDKVKVVRETMNQMIDAWKKIPDISIDVSMPPQPKSSSIDSSSDGHFPAVSVSSNTVKSSSSFTRRKSPLSRSSLSVNEKDPSLLRKLERIKPLDWKVDIASPNTPSSHGASEDNLQNKKGLFGRFYEHGEKESDKHSKVEAKRILFDYKHDDKGHKYGGLRSNSRVVPVHEKESSESTMQPSVTSEDLSGSHKDNDLSMIRKQLVQIENQQSMLLDLLQRFIGSSQNGMHSLETRVHGLEVALDEISHDLAVSSGRMGNIDTMGNSCFRLPGADFLSSKLWRRAESRYSVSRFSTSSSTPLVTMHNITDKEAANSDQLDSWRLGLKGGFVVNPLAEIHPQSSTEPTPNRMRKTGTVHEAVARQAHHGSGSGEARPAELHQN